MVGALHLRRQAFLRVDDLEDDAQLEHAGIQRALPCAINLRGSGWLRRSRQLGCALEIEFQRQALRKSAVYLRRILVDRAFIGDMSWVEGEVELGILERDGGQRKTGALINAVKRRREASVLGRGDVQKQVKLRAGRDQRSLPIPGD